ncbi:hypothetical protein NX02_09345 [Sphingomonas sanxanigenens DSM 19645 = NX02]|uniref:TonB-dependent receptor plug domain-containing protein n=2 Tax=Sphingomonas sanxanigenens TaxID=397260 RepID=W0AD44_9SPHN|nr:hypothetical protein NX02_09345 [Sphingomonas sanxanigenens DSM 19645 = NX02]
MDVRTALRRLIAGTPLRIDTDDGQIITLRSAGKGAALRKKAGERVEVGVIVGRVIDPATGEYKRDAIIRLITAAGERQTVASNEGGEFRILDVPTGSAKVTVSFTGYADQASAVQVIAGKTVTLDFALLAPGEEARGPEIVVTGGREGDARAIMSQRRSMNITNNLSSESFGEVSEGNVGEFLKFMPGVVTQNQGGADDTVRYVGLRGLPPEYTSVDRRGKRTPVAG